MRIDSGIYAAFAPKVRSVADYDNEYAQQQANQLQMLLGQNQLAEVQRARTEREALNRAWQGALGPDGMPDENALYRALAGSGQGAAIPALQSKFLDQRKTRAETERAQAGMQKDKAETVAKQLGLMKDLSGSVLANPTREAAIAAVQRFGALTGLDVSQDLAAVQALQSSDDVRRWAAGNALQAEKLLPQFQARDTGGQVQTLAIDPLTGLPTVTSSLVKTQTPDSVASNARMAADAEAQRAVSIRGQNMSDARARETAAVQRQANEINREAQQTQIINDPVLGPLLINKGTKTATPAISTATGQPIPGEKAVAKKEGAKAALGLIKEADALIDKATGSGIGAGADYVAGMAGVSTTGAQSIARLRVIEGALLAQMPRMEGPQSNYDVQNYKQAAAQLGDPTIPRETKKQALAELRRIQEAYADGGAQGSWGGPERRAAPDLPSASAIDAELARRKGAK